MHRYIVTIETWPINAAPKHTIDKQFTTRLDALAYIQAYEPPPETRVALHLWYCIDTFHKG